MKRTLAALMIAMMIGHITALAAFPTFVWTEEYRSELYAVEIMDDISAALVDEEIIVFDTAEDELATPTDLDTTSSDEGMNNAGYEEEPDSVAQFITSYDIELETEDGLIPDEGMNIAGDDEIEEEPDSVAQFITSYDIEPATREEEIEPQQEENTEPKQEG